MPIAHHHDTFVAPDRLRPYVFHGADLVVQGSHAVGDCPFCGREGKFSVDTATGLWRCFVCGVGSAAGGGNGLVFTRLVHEYAASAATGERGAKFRASVASDRRLLSPDTVAVWGIVPADDGTWLVPGYSTEGRLDQVYRRVRVQDKGAWVWRLLPTPGIWPDGKAHALHLPTNDFNSARPNLLIMEGVWDGMTLWEVWDQDETNTNIVAVPGCNVWRDEWTEMCRGKQVTVMYDSDYPRPMVPGSDRTSRAGYDGMARVAKRLSGVAASVRWMKWGESGYDPVRPSGWDVRDHLCQGRDWSQRWTALEELLGRVEDAPQEWFSTAAPQVNGYHHPRIAESMSCSTWAMVEAAWEKAMHWRQNLGDALAVMLAVCASTKQAGNQLFLDIIASPGSAKTTLCKGLLVSTHCVHLENITKLVSGYKKSGDDGKDCSFIARANGKTWVTCEFDVLASSPQYRDLMGKVRRIFDGETSATYGNSDEDRIYTALRTPWIRAGTRKMVDHDQSQLGDRFLRCFIDDPDEDEKRAITRRALRSERAAIVETANAASSSVLDHEMRRAHCLTGGYVDWLRANAEGELVRLDVPESAEDYCIDLADLSADLRARPTWEDRNKSSPSEVSDYKELPTRLARQNIRLASCLAVVLNKRLIDSDVLRIVRKVALDTASGHSLSVVTWLCSPNPRAGVLYQESGGLGNAILEGWTGMSKERLEKYMCFLRKIDVVRWNGEKQGRGAWQLTDRVYSLYLRVMT